MSAILKTGKFINAVEIKSTTKPRKILSIAFPNAPAKSKQSDAFKSVLAGFFLYQYHKTPTQKIIETMLSSPVFSDSILNAAPVFFTYTKSNSFGII